MKKLCKTVVIALILVFCAMQSFACSLAPSGQKEKVDNSKSQLRIANYNGGMGEAWLEAYARAFEKMYEEESFEEGKKGVEVHVSNSKETYKSDKIANNISTSSQNLYFVEGVNYFQLIKDGKILDITDIVSGEQSDLADFGESGKKIEDKLTEDQKTYYASYDGKYYGLPHYCAYRGIVYDKDLFNAVSPLYKTEPLYITGDTANNNHALYNDGWIVLGKKSTDSGRSCGPDGIVGTNDDGLPATYQEFFDWCKYVKAKRNIIPITWTGTYAESYTGHLIDALTADINGKELMDAYNNVSSSPMDITVISGFNGDVPTTETIAFSRSNYKDGYKMLGFYYSYYFLDKLIKNDYQGGINKITDKDHDAIHGDFLYSSYDREVVPNSIAMMIESTWWEEESFYIFEQMDLDYNNASRSDRNFGFLALPKIDYDHLGPQTLYDGNGAITFINANCKGKIGETLSKLFIKFISTDANLQLFTTTTGISRDYQYNLEPNQINSLSSFAKDIYYLQKGKKDSATQESVATDIVYSRARTYSNYVWSNTSRSKIDTKVLSGSAYSTFYTAKTAKDFYLKVLELNKITLGSTK